MRILLYFVAGSSLIIFLYTLWRMLRARRLRNRILSGGVGLIALLGLVVSLFFLQYVYRPRPDDTQMMLFQGIEYIRDVREDPEIIIHVVKIDLDAAGIEFLVTPGKLSDDQHVLEARTTSQFLEAFDLQLAINGDFFDPFYTHSVTDYYPHTGDPVSTRGLAASKGDVYTHGYYAPSSYDTLFISEANDASFVPPVAESEIYNAVSGWMLIVQNGHYQSPSVEGFDEYFYARHPRTSAGLDETAETLILFVVDGRQPNYSKGVSLPELAEIMIEYGVFTGLNLDGGGSSGMVMEGNDGRAELLSSPIDNRIPGRERVVANHLGVYARRISEN